jgi:hypothetical protein
MAAGDDNKHAHAGQPNSFTHLRALLVLHDRSIMAHATSVAEKLKQHRVPVDWIVSGLASRAPLMAAGQTISGPC